MPAHLDLFQRAIEPSADCKPCAGDMAAAVMRAGRKIHNRHVVDLKNFAGIDGRIGWWRTEHDSLCRAGFVSGFRQHGDILPAHLFEPGRGHERARFPVVAQHDAGAKRAGINVRCLHQLAAGCRNRPGKMSGREFGRIAHVENVSGARRILAPCLDLGAV